MIDVIEIIVSINGATATMSEQIYSNNANQYRALVKFEDESWENYDKMIVFDRVKNYDTPIGIMVNEDNVDYIEIVDDRSFYCIIPWEVLTQPGYFNISIHGTLNDSQKSISIKDKITIYDGGNATIYPRVPTPNMYGQLLNILEKIEEKIDDAGGEVEEVKEDIVDIREDIKNLNEKIDDKSTGYVFDTIEELESWLLIEENVGKLNIGDEFYIRDNSVPDYWWDGTQILPLESKSVGQFTENGGEIFNDYENNKAIGEYSSASGLNTTAGALAKGFNILNIEHETSNLSPTDNFYIQISNTTGLTRGDRILLHSEILGETLEILEGMYITLDNKIGIETRNGYSDDATGYTGEESPSHAKLCKLSYEWNGTTEEYLTFPEKPDLMGDKILETLGTGAHSEGYNTKAIGNYSHAGGKGTIALGEAQTAIGKYNERNSNALFIIGGGDSEENRQNAFVVNADGSISGEAEKFLAGKKTEDGGEIFNDYENNKALSNYSSVSGSGNAAGGKGFNILDLTEAGEENGVMTYALLISDFSNIESGDIFSLYSSKLLNNFDFIGKVERMVDISDTNDGSENMRMIVTGIPDGLYPLNGTTTEYIWFPEKPDLNGDLTLGTAAHAEGYNTRAIMVGSHAEGGDTIAAGKYAHAEGRQTKAGYASHSEGYITEATGVGSHVEGFYSKANGEAAHAEGLKTQALGNYTHSEGVSTLANEQAAHAEGYRAKALGIRSHAEGTETESTGENSHAEGYRTKALNANDHAEGSVTIAKGNSSHASGWNTIASSFAQTVVGKANIEVPGTLFIVGNGKDADNRSNAFVVKTDGSATIKTSGTNDLNVVNYKQLKEYVANNGKSPWDSQSEMLFSTGALKILNHIPTSEGEDDTNYGIYLNNGWSYNARFTSNQLFLQSLASDSTTSLAPPELTIETRDSIPNISLKKINAEREVVTSLDINTNDILYNGKSITWDRLFAAIEKIENSY